MPICLLIEFAQLKDGGYAQAFVFGILILSAFLVPVAASLRLLTLSYT